MSSKLFRYTRKCHRASSGIFYSTLFALLLGITANVEVFASISFKSIDVDIYSCGVKHDGNVTCWGVRNDGGATLPNGTFTQISTGWFHACGLKTDGNVVCWGINEFGQINPPSGTFTQIDAGQEFNCGIKTDGTVKCWGKDDFSQITSSPSGTFTQISVGWHHACGVRSNDSVVCWGEDQYGKTNAPSGTFTQVTAAYHHSCGVKTDGNVACWDNHPLTVMTPPPGKFRQVSGGGVHTCGVKTDGSVACWGNNDNNQATPPTGTFTQVKAGLYHTCGVKTDDRVVCWGDNQYDQSIPPSLVSSTLGIAPLTVTLDATNVVGSSILNYEWYADDQFVRAGNPTNYTLMESGKYVIKLVATHNDGSKSETLENIRVMSPPVPKFTVISSSGNTVTLDASASHDPDGSIVSYQWTFNGQTREGLTITVPIASRDNVELIVTDNDGLTARTDSTQQSLYSLTIRKSGAGSGRITGQSIDCGNDCSEEYAKNTQVSLTATPNANSSFVGWSGVCSGTDTCQVTMNQEQEVKAIFELINGKGAAIIIHPKGSNRNTTEEAVSFMAKYAYNTLLNRNYDSETIYLLSHQPDLDVNTVDAPVTGQEFRQAIPPRDITVSDIDKAFSWAKEKGTLDYPLVVIFVDHGEPNELILSNTERLTAQELKTILDDYQNATNNQIVVILEACHTGTLVSTIAGENRIIISSTDEKDAYYDDLGEIAFLKFYLDQLRREESFWHAWEVVKEKMLGYPLLAQQSPQLEDSNNGLLAKDWCLNSSCSGNLAGLNDIEVEQLPPIISLGEPIELTVSTDGERNIHSVEASFLKAIGKKINQAVRLFLNRISTTTRRKNDEDSKVLWKAQVPGDQLMIPGTYTLTAQGIEDNGLSMSDEIIFCIESCDEKTQEENTQVSPAQLINISTRAPILGGANDVIAGFIITGEGTQKIVLRGWGLDEGVNPKLQLQKLNNGTWDIIAINDDWQTDARYAEIPQYMTTKFESNDAALLLDLPAGVYTVTLSSVGTKGLGLVGVDAIDSNQNIKLINISTRAPIKGGANDVIAGFIITGEGTQKIVLRGWGLDEGVNPKLQLQKLNNGTWDIIAINDNWQTDARYAEIPQYMTTKFESNDAALLLDLPAGVYTVTLSSVGANGLGLVGVDAID